MNIQIYALKKNFDVQKAERYFKERSIKFQSIDLSKKPMGARELDSVCRAVGGVDELIDRDNKAYAGTTGEDKNKEQLLANIKLRRTPVVRNGQKATVGYKPEVWDTWE